MSLTWTRRDSNPRPLDHQSVTLHRRPAARARKMGRKCSASELQVHAVPAIRSGRRRFRWMRCGDPRTSRSRSVNSRGSNRVRAGGNVSPLLRGVAFVHPGGASRPAGPFCSHPPYASIASPSARCPKKNRPARHLRGRGEKASLPVNVCQGRARARTKPFFPQSCCSWRADRRRSCPMPHSCSPCRRFRYGRTTPPGPAAGPQG